MKTIELLNFSVGALSVLADKHYFISLAAAKRHVDLTLYEPVVVGV